MIDVLLAADVQRQDEEAAARGVGVERLMENAGHAVARAARRMMGGTYGRRVAVVCGKGNNGGDGLVAGRVLTGWGAHVTALLAAEPSSPLATLNRERFPGRVAGLDPRELARADLVIDALLGVGARRAPEGPIADAIAAIEASGRRVLAVDVPSGVDSDTGQVQGAAVSAEATVTFGGLKPGLLFAPGAARAGRVEVAAIGAARAGLVAALEADDVRPFVPRRGPGEHKRSVGTVLVVAGSRAMPGAASLVCGAAVHAGAGLTILCGPESVCRLTVSRIPEVTTIPVPETEEGTLHPKALDLLRPRLDEFHAVTIGPGLTTHPATVETVRALVGELRPPVVLDADALNACAGAPDLLASRARPTILTPHAGELGRLLGRPAAELEADRLAAARDAHERTGATVVLKGPGTVIRGTETFVNTTGGASLAQGGTGDVLTGLLGAFVATAARRGEAIGPGLVAAAVWLHGHAADRIAARIEPHPANASALIAELGPAMHEVAG